MDLAFIRNQVELKLTEFETLNNLYIEGLEKEFHAFDKIITGDQRTDIAEMLEELKAYSENVGELKLEFGATVSQLTGFYADIQQQVRVRLKEKK